MNQLLKLAAAALGGVVVTLAAGGIAMAGMDKGLGHFGNADADGNGEITRAEWVAAANTRFDALDTNKDGKLVVGEIPRGGEGHGRRGHRGHHGPEGDDWDNDAPPPPAAAAPAAAPAQPAPAPAPSAAASPAAK